MTNKAKVTETAFKTHGYTIALVYLRNVDKVYLISETNFVMFSEMNFLIFSSISVIIKTNREGARRGNKKVEAGNASTQYSVIKNKQYYVVLHSI